MVEKFAALNTGTTLQVYGGDDRIEGLTKKVGQDDCLTIGQLNVRCLFTPCHTTGHICYFVESPSSGEKCVFTGLSNNNCVECVTKC